MQLPIRLDRDSREPMYHQLENELKALIAGGHLDSGTALPSIRVLSKDLEISVITTRRAYQNLESNGFIKTIQGKGTFVADVSQKVKNETKAIAIHETIQKAVETAINYDYTAEQIEAIFKDVLAASSKDKGGQKNE